MAVLNNADSGGHDNEEAAAAVADFPELEYIANPIRRRKQIANATGQGTSALEYSPKDAKAPARKTVPKPPTKRVHNPRKPHVSLAKLLAGAPWNHSTKDLNA